MNAFSSDASFEIIYRPKYLNLSLPEEGVLLVDYFTEKFGADKAKKYMEETPKYMANLGIEFKLPKYKVPPTKAYCLVDYAATVGKQIQTVKQLYKAYYVDDKRIDSVETLKEIALKCGLDPEEAARHMSDPSVTAQVKETDTEERKAGHTFVPHYDICIKGKPSNLLSFVGPQTADTFKGAFQQLLE